MRLAAVVLAFLLLGAGCARVRSATPGTVDVVAAENFWGDIARQIGGAHVRVTSIINDPAADPHLYESDARDAATIARARLVIENGAGYDDQIQKLLSGSDARFVNVAHVLDTHGDANPHLWYAVDRVPTVARAIGDALGELDPRDKASFDANVARFDASLQPVLETLQTIKRRYPAAPVAYTERVAGYLLDVAGLRVRTPSGFARSIEDGTEPSPRDTQAMNALLRNRDVRVLVYNAQATNSTTQHLRELAAAARVAVVPVTETMPKGAADYQTWQLNQARRLLSELGG